MVINWRVVGWIAAGVVLLLVVVAVFVGVKEALVAAGAIGAAAGARKLQKTVSGGKQALNRADSVAEHLPEIPKEKEVAARTEVAALSDREKLDEAKRLLGGDE